MRYLITGGTGFLGCYVTRELLAAGHSVACFELRPDLTTLELVAGRSAGPDLTILPGDVTQPMQLVAAASQLRPDVLIHLASPLPPDTERDATLALTGMTQGHVNVLETARIVGAKKVVWASATSVFGRPAHHGGLESTVPNDAAHHPETLYGIFKSANERLAEFFWERHGVDAIGLRFCQVYGPGKRRGRPFGYRLFEHALLGEPYLVPYGDDVVNWQYVDDVAALIVRVSHAPPTRTRTFNTTGQVLSMSQTLDILRDLLPQARLELEPGTTGLVWHYDTAALEREVGVGPPTPVHEGFERTIATMRQWKDAGVW
jgi:nucleoside-diphosphate-sugar epimerase